MWYLKTCDKCGGDMYSISDRDWETKECIQCGVVVYLKVALGNAKKNSWSEEGITNC